VTDRVARFGFLQSRFNESGFHPWASAHDNVAIAPQSNLDEEVAIAEDGQRAQPTVLAGIKADGSVFGPRVTLWRRSIETELHELNYMLNERIYAMQESGFIKTSRTVLLPFVRQVSGGMDAAHDCLAPSSGPFQRSNTPAEPQDLWKQADFACLRI
jgi:hypothetical protein